MFSNLNIKLYVQYLLSRFDKKEKELLTTKQEFESLKSENENLSENIKNLLIEKRQLELTRKSSDQELIKLKIDLNKMKTPPLLLGVITKVFQNNTAVVRSSAGPQLVVQIPLSLSTKKLSPGMNVGLNQQSYSIVSILHEYEDESDVSFMELIDPIDTTYDQIGGLDSQIQEIKEIIELPMLKPEAFVNMGLVPPSGALLYGPPGTGKTMLAKAIANSTKSTFIRVVGSELVQKYIGDGSKMVHDLFSFAKKKAPSIIFIDEIDSIASKRIDDTTGGDREVYRILMQLLYEMDGFNKVSNVKIIGATNRIEILDRAILRPGRFDRLVYMPLPNLENRYSILKIQTCSMPISDHIDLYEIAKKTEGYSGADLKNTARSARGRVNSPAPA